MLFQLIPNRQLSNNLFPFTFNTCKPPVTMQAITDHLQAIGHDNESPCSLTSSPLSQIDRASLSQTIIISSIRPKPATTITILCRTSPIFEAAQDPRSSLAPFTEVLRYIIAPFYIQMGLRGGAVAGALPNLIRSLRKDPKARAQQSLPSLRRAFSLYDQINLIDNVPDDQLRFQGYTDTGFKVNGVDYEGSLLCIGNMLMSWAPNKFSDITPHSLSMFQLVRPIPEILILGCGRYIEPIDPELRRFIRSTGMKLEAVDSRNAISTYNILNEEGRIVAAALLPYGCGVSS